MTTFPIRFFFGLLILCVSGCSKRFPDYWVGNLQPQASFDSVTKVFGLNDSAYKITENHHLAPGDKRPRFDIVSIEFQWTDLEQSGTLRLKFYNDSLTEAWFFPLDQKKYLEALRTNKGIDLEPISGGRCGPKSRILRGIDFKNRPYIMWEDIKTSDERDRWVRKYS